MSKPTGTAITSGGDTMATEALPGITGEVQAVIPVGADGHMIGSRPDFLIWFTPAANAANRILGDIYNTGTVPIRVRGLWIVPTFTSITGAQIGWSAVKTSAAGTGGSAITPIVHDAGAGTWPAAATVRANPTGGATTSATLFETYTFNEETNAGFAILPYQNQFPQLGDRVFEIVLEQNEGFAVKQIVTNTVGLTGMLILATYDD